MAGYTREHLYMARGAATCDFLSTGVNMKLPSNVIIAELFIMLGVGWLALKRFASSEVCQTGGGAYG